MANTRSITIAFAAPTDAGDTFAGVYLYFNMPAQSGVKGDLNTSTPLDATGSLGGVTTPVPFGPFPWADFPGSVTQMVPEPATHPMTCSVTVVSYSGSTINGVSGSPTATFVIPKVGPRTAANAHTSNPGAFGLLSDTRNTVTGISYDVLQVSQSAPNDPSFQGVVYVILDPSGNLFWESAPQTAATATLRFPTPGTPGVYTVYACGWDGTNVNPIVPGITPSFTITLGTSSGTISPSQIPTGSGVNNSNGALALKYGAALADDGSGNITVLASGPLYKDVSGNLNIQLASDFTVSNGVLTQNTVNLAKAINFNTTNFSTAGGALIINQVGVNSLIAGTALFTGTTTFAYTSTGAYVQVGSAGMVMGDNLASPSATVTVTSGGVTVAKGSNSVQVTALGVAIYGPSGSFTATSGGVAITNGTSGVTVTANSVTVAQGTFSIAITASAIQINAGSTYTKLTATDWTMVNPGQLAAVFDLYSSGSGASTVASITINASNGSATGQIYCSNAVSSFTLNSGYGGMQIVCNSSTPYITIQGYQVLTARQTGLGNPTGWTDATALAWVQNLYSKLSAHGLIT